MLHQYFLSNPLILEQEIDFAELQKDDTVLEIGAGPGYLTREIASEAKVLAVEKDKKFIRLLKQIENAEIYHEDALDFLGRKQEFNKVISNIPYYLSQPILLALLKHRWKICVLLVQKEFAEKIFSGEKLGMMVQDCCDAKMMGSVPGDEFSPKGADSVFLILRQNKLMEEKFWGFLKHAYRMKNRNADKLGRCPDDLKNMKIHQLSLRQVREIYSLNKD